MARAVKLLPCTAWDKAQNYTGLEGKDSMCLAKTWPGILQRQFVRDLCSGQVTGAQLSQYTREGRLSTVLGQAVSGILLTFICSPLWCCSCVLTLRYLFSTCKVLSVS